jgi:PAS domain-containing protein
MPNDPASPPVTLPYAPTLDALRAADPPTRRARTDAALREPARLAALEASGLLDRASTEALERIARVTARALGAPAAQVNVITADAQVPVACAARVGPVPESWSQPAAIDQSYCQYVAATGEPLVVRDAPNDPFVADSPATATHGVGAYAAVPLRAPAARGGHVLGSLCVIDVEPRDWSDEQLALLDDFGAMATAQIVWRDVVDGALDASEAHLTETVASTARAEGDAARARAALQSLRRRLAFVLEHAPAAIALVDHGGLIELANPAFTALADAPNAVLGRPLDRVLSAYAPVLTPHVTRVLAGGAAGVDIALAADGPNARAWSASVHPVRDAAEAVVAAGIILEKASSDQR